MYGSQSPELQGPHTKHIIVTPHVAQRRASKSGSLQVSIVQHRALVLRGVQVIIAPEVVALWGPSKACRAPKSAPARRPPAHHAPAPARCIHAPAHHGCVHGRPATFHCWHSNEGPQRASTCTMDSHNIICRLPPGCACMIHSAAFSAAPSAQHENIIDEQAPYPDGT